MSDSARQFGSLGAYFTRPVEDAEVEDYKVLKRSRPSFAAAENKENDQGAAPLCRCADPETCVVKTVQKDGLNKGRQFYVCPRSRDVQCDFFEWAEQSTPSAAASVSSEGSSIAPDAAKVEAPMCRCMEPSDLKTVQKEGPTKGKTFFCCKTKACNFFEWSERPTATTAPSAAPVAVAAAGISATGGSCYKCGQSGHWSKSCPARVAGVSAAGSVGGTCFKCGVAGHYANSCPSATGKRKF